MKDYEDKDRTFIFKPEDGEKKPVLKKETPPEVDEEEYERPAPRKRRKKKESHALVYVAIGLSILLVVVIAIAISVLKSDEEPKNPIENEPTENVGEKENEEEAPPVQEEPEKETVRDYYIVFDAEEKYLLEDENGYSIAAEFYDEDGYKEKTGKVRITDETDIRDNGNRISTKTFVNKLSEQNENRVKFESEIREKDGIYTALSITYDSRDFKKPVEEEVIEDKEDEVVIIEIIDDEEKEKPKDETKDEKKDSEDKTKKDPDEEKEVEEEDEPKDKDEKDEVKKDEEPETESDEKSDEKPKDEKKEETEKDLPPQEIEGIEM